jgi:hypothetical protein
MNNRNAFRPSTELSDRFAALEARAEIDAMKNWKAAHMYDVDPMDGFEPGVLNEEELAMMEEDPSMEHFFKMCSQKELESMRRMRQEARRERISRVQ